MSRAIRKPHFKQAVDVHEHGYYSLAYPIFRELESGIRETDRSNNAVVFDDLRYYYLVCSLEQNDKGAVEPAQDFIDLGKNIARVEMMNFHLAEYEFRQRDYSNAVRLYEHAGIDNLTNREIADLKFHEGYGYFTQKQFGKGICRHASMPIQQLPQGCTIMSIAQLLLRVYMLLRAKM